MALVEREPVNVTMTNQEIGAKLNAALIGEGNTASVIVEPYLQRSGDQLVVGNVELEAWVSREAKDGTNVPIYELSGRGKEKGITRAEVDSAYQGWKKRALKQWDGYLKREKQWLGKSNDSSSAVASKGGSALDSIEAWSDRNPLEVSTTFDNEAGPDFSRIFEEAPRLPDTPATRERLRDYAMRLRDLMAQKDTAGLVKEFRPEMRYSYQIGAHDASSFEEYVSTYQKHYVLEGAEEELDFSRTDVKLRPWVGGRVWQLRRKDAEGLLRRIEVYVAELEGDLRVVR
jgi:hypothetical protein